MEDLYYVHKMGSQELGSVDKHGGISQRGKYIYLSKKLISFFPKLASQVLNDEVGIFLVPTWGNRVVKILTTLKYHNQKHSVKGYKGKNPRDEFRLYLNEEDNLSKIFNQGDFVVLKKIGETNTVYTYSISCIKPGETGYDSLGEEMTKKTKKISSGNHFLCEHHLNFIVDPVITNDTEVLISKNFKKWFEKNGKSKNSKTVQKSITVAGKFFNSAIFHKVVLEAYGGKCAITHQSIEYKDKTNIQSCHIKPRAMKGQYLPSNGIALCRDMHYAFDNGFIAIDDDYRIIVAKEIDKSELYKKYNGKKLFIPQEEFYKPDKRFLKFHRERIFERFESISKLKNEDN